MFSDADIKQAIANQRIDIYPYREEHVEPASIDVCLDHQFRIFANHQNAVIDPSQEMSGLTTLKHIERGPFILHPGEFVLGSTVEHVTLGDDVAARLEGKSSLGRLGLLTHATAGFIDPGFTGHITLELTNVAKLPIMLWPGMKIGQLCFFGLDTRTESPYGADRGSHYQGQRGPTESRSWDGFTTVPMGAVRQDGETQ